MQAKKFLTENGHTEKSLILLSIFKRFNLDLDNDKYRGRREPELYRPGLSRLEGAHQRRPAGDRGQPAESKGQSFQEIEGEIKGRVDG